MGKQIFAANSTLVIAERKKMDQEVKFSLKERNFIVTGASSGIGRQIVLEVAEAGGRVLAVGRNKERLEETVSNYPDQIMPAMADVRNYSLIEAYIRDFTKKYGKFNGAVHAAGSLLITPLRKYQEEEARELVDVSFWSGIKLIQIASKKSYGVPESSYVLISSVCAHKGEAAQFALNAAKISLQVAARTLAKEIYQQGSRINTISPGLILTGLTEHDFDERGISEVIKKKHLLGLGKVEDVSGLTLYLLSNRARWITGQDFVIDGGYLISD